MLDPGQQRVVRLRPGFHFDCAAVEHKDCRQTRLKLAEYDTVFDEAVVSAMILKSELSVLECSMVPFKAAGEGGHRTRSIFRTDPTRRNQRGDVSDAVGSQQLGVLHLIQNLIRPPHSRMLCAECITEFKPLKIEGD